jgi:NAD(P)-dependent dehydrogenase (short-subunit alcohol dehydrogenase family)
MQLELSGRIALVTGATRGIGAAIAATLAEEGATVIGTGRSPDSIAAAAERAGGRSPVADYVIADLNDPHAPARLVEAVASRFGQLDILVNNASSSPPTTMGELRRQDWLDLTGQKLAAYTELILAARPLLRASDSAAVVNIAGITGHVPRGDAPHRGAINAGILNMTRYLAMRLAPDRIRVNAVSPGDTNTGRRQARLRRLVAEGLTQAQAEAQLTEGIPLGRTIQPTDIASAVTVLCSPRFGAVTGAALLVDGGAGLSA